MVSLNPRASRALALAGISLLLLSACSRTGTSDGTGDSDSSSSTQMQRSSAARSQSSARRAASSAARSRASSSDDTDDSSAPFFSLKRSSSSRATVAANTSSTNSAAAQPVAGNIGIQIETDREEGRPGDSLFVTVTLQNTSNANLNNFQVVYSFSPVQLTVLESDGISAADHIRWNIDSLAPNQKRALRLRAQLLPGLRHGEVVRSTAIVTVNGIVDPSTAVSDIRVIEQLPATGLGDGTRPLENTRRFLSPFRSSQGSAGIPAALWTVTILMGMGLGGAAVKKYL